MNKLLLVAQNEFVRRVRRPSFLILTFLLPLLGFVGIVASGAARGGAAPTSPSALVEAAQGLAKPFGYVDQAGVIRSIPAELPAGALRAFPTEAEAQTALGAGTIGSYYLLPPDYLQTGHVVRVAQRRSLTAEDSTLFAALLRANLAGDPSVAARLAQPLAPEVVRLDDAGNPVQERQASDELARNPLVFVVPYIFTMTLYFAIVFASGFMLQSVTEEKENRTIELLLTSLRPWQLLGGKVLGLGALGLLQTAVWLGASRLLLGFGGGSIGDASALNLPASVWALVIAYFVLGYGVYASLLAGVGATITNPREGSQLTLLVLAPIIVPLWFIGAIIARPDGLVATVLSIFPLTAPVTMIIRITLGAAPGWQVALSIALLAGAVALSLWAASRLFRVQALLAGKKLSLGEIAAAMRS